MKQTMNKLTKASMAAAIAASMGFTSLTVLPIAAKENKAETVAETMKAGQKAITSLQIQGVDQTLCYLTPGQTLALSVVDQDGTAVDADRLQFETNRGDGYVSVDENGVITAHKRASSPRTITQINVSLKDDSSIKSYMKVVVAIPASFEGICISGSNKTDNKNFTDFQSGGSVSDNAGHSYGFQLIDEIAEWDDETSDRYGNEGKYSIEYYLDGESQGVSYPAWSKPTQHSAGLKDDSSFYITIPTYGTHEVKAVLTGNDGSTCEKSIQLTTTPLWFTAPNVTKVSANAGDVVIPDTLNGKTVSALKGNSASDGVQAGVTSLTIPDSVTSIDAAFFAKAVDLTQINFLGDVPNGNLDLSNVALTDGSIQVPSEYLQDYLQTAAAQWNKGDCPLSWEEIFNVDTEAPIVEVHYSNSELTNADVVVTLKVNEQIETPQGWTKVSETAYTKVFSENGEETVELKDLAGNVTTVNVVVSNIDKSAPQLFVEDQSIRQGESFDPMAIVSAKDGDVDLSDRVTFEGEVDVQTPGVYTLTYSVSDAAGNTTEKTIQVTVLSSVQDPEDEVKDEEGEKEEETDSVDTGVFAQEGMAAISLLGAALGVTLLSAKKRRTNEQR